jgi:hypothetical protein
MSGDLTSVFFYDVMNQHSCHAEVWLLMPGEEVREILSTLPQMEPPRALAAFIGALPAGANEEAVVQVHGIPCETATDWYDNFATAAGTAIAWDPAAQREITDYEQDA